MNYNLYNIQNKGEIGSPPAQKGYWFASMLACFVVIVHIPFIEAVQHAILSWTSTLANFCCMVMIRILSEESEFPAEPGFVTQSGVTHQLRLLSASWLWYKCSLQKLNIQQNQDHTQSWAKYQHLLLSASRLWYNSLYRSWLSSRTSWSETSTLVTFWCMVMIETLFYRSSVYSKTRVCAILTEASTVVSFCSMVSVQIVFTEADYQVKSGLYAILCKNIN